MTLGVIAGLVVGKPLGVFVTTFLLARFTRRQRSTTTWPGATCSVWRLLAGIGFTVSLLIGELAFGYGTVTAPTPRSVCWSGPWSQVCWPRWC